MPRRNRKGRRPGQRPRLFHPESRREAKRDQRELSRMLAAPAPPPLPRECGSCLEWIAPGDTLLARGRCAHPASGVFASPSDMPACEQFNPRR